MKNNFQKKYLKYNKKILLLNQNGGSYIYDIFTIWINNKKTTISDDVKIRIERIANLFYINNNSLKLKLFLDYKLTLEEDIKFFSSIDYLDVCNLWSLPTIMNSKEIQRIFMDDVPIYVRVDVLKIIGMHDLLNLLKHNVEKYVVFTDIDLLTVDDDIPSEKLTCNKNTLPVFSNEYLFDSVTLNLLNLFGIVMSENTKSNRNSRK
jgi:hypothetical protein